MVFGPMVILRFSRMAARTSASHTKAAGCGGGSAFAGAASAGPSVSSQLYPPELLEPLRRERKRSTTPAAALATTDCVTGAEQYAPTTHTSVLLPRTQYRVL